MEIEWKSFKSFKELLVESTDYCNKSAENYCRRSGVYLHTIHHPQYGELVDYVGKLKQPRIIERQIEHYRNIIGGIYGFANEIISIFDDNKEIEKINLKGQDFYNGLRNDINTKGFEPPQVSEYFGRIFNEAIFLKLVPIFFKYANATNVYLGKVIDNKQIEPIERKLVFQLEPIRNWTRYKDNNSSIQHRGDLDDEKIKKLADNNKNFGNEREKNNKPRFMVKY